LSESDGRPALPPRPCARLRRPGQGRAAPGGLPELGPRGWHARAGRRTSIRSSSRERWEGFLTRLSGTSLANVDLRGGGPASSSPRPPDHGASARALARVLLSSWIDGARVPLCHARAAPDGLRAEPGRRPPRCRRGERVDEYSQALADLGREPAPAWLREPTASRALSTDQRALPRAPFSRRWLTCGKGRRGPDSNTSRRADRSPPPVPDLQRCASSRSWRRGSTAAADAGLDAAGG